MLLKPGIQLKGNLVRLRDISKADAGTRYQKWMEDQKVAKFLASGVSHYTQEELATYIEKAIASPSSLLLAIELTQNKLHVGNIKLDIDHRHRIATLGLMIGESSVWGKGIGTEAIALLSEYAFTELHVRKICAGVIKGNEGSKKAFEKSGYTVYTIRREQFLVDNSPVDEYLLERFNPHPVSI